MADHNWHPIDPRDEGCIVAADRAAGTCVPPVEIRDYLRAWITELAPGRGPIYQVEFKGQVPGQAAHPYLGFAWKRGATNDTIEAMSCQLFDPEGEN